MKIEFPKTNLVECKFVFKQSNDFARDAGMYNEMDILEEEYIRKQKSYVYRLPENLVGHVHGGDAVLVHCQTGYQMCMVTLIDVTSSLPEEKIAPVVCKLDLVDYYDGIKKQKELKYMKQKLQAEKKRLEALVTYEMIAEKHPEFKALLDQFKELGGDLS